MPCPIVQLVVPVLIKKIYMYIYKTNIYKKKSIIIPYPFVPDIA